MNKKFRASVLMTACISLLLCGCKDGKVRIPFSSESETSADPFSNAPIVTNPEVSGIPTVSDPPSGPAEPLTGNRGTMLELQGDGFLNIIRLEKENESSLTDDGVWTVFVYMCGSDLESDQASATEDLEEMLDATDYCDSLRFVVETGGTAHWQNDFCKNNEKQRFLIQDGDIIQIYSGSSANMGNSSTLSDFLKWAVKEYPSQFMALDFWNHGGGSISGVCFDEINDYDSLSLKEIDTALASVFNDMTDRFELIGCDACLMATVETANTFAPYARYMVASQNIESGYGWDYTAFAEAIEGGAKNGGEVGKKLCDAYYTYCTYTGEEDDATLSVVELSKFDQFVQAFNEYSNELYRYASNKSVTDIIISAKTTLNFGGNNKSEGYTNMIDARGLMYLTSDYAPSAEAAMKALDDCIFYSKNGYGAYSAGGLCIYYPLSVQGSNEIGIFKDICISPYYLSLVDLCAYGSDNYGDTDGFDFDSWLGLNSDFWSDSDISDSEYDYWNSDDDASLNLDVNNSALEYEIAPHLNDDGNYVFKLTEDSLYNLDTVYCNVMQSYWDDEYGREYMLDLGTDDYVDLDWETGVCKDAFDGLWISLPDGQNLCAYLIDTTYGEVYSNTYTCPIYLNGEYTNLKIMQTYYDGKTVTEALGTWTGVDESGAVARDVYPLQNGDVIEPCYPAYDAETFEYVCDYYGSPYTYRVEDPFGYDYLEDSDYYYSFEIYDYYGNGLYPDFVLFGVEDGELFYYN